MFNMIVEIIYILILSFNISIIAAAISLEKINLKNTLTMTIIIYIPSYLIYSNNINVILVPVSVVITFLYCFWIFKKIYFSIFISIFTQIIFALSDAITGIIFIFIFKFKYIQIDNNKLLLSIIIIIISFIISKISYKIINNQHLKDFKTINKKFLFIFFLCLITALVSVYSYTIIFTSLNKYPNKINIILNFFLILIYFIILIIITQLNHNNVKKRLEQKWKETEFKRLKEYIDMVELVSADLRSFKHDYLNILNIIGDYLDSKSFNELNEFYVRELMPQSIKILEKDRYFILLHHIKISPLKGLISSKIIIAQSKEIIIKLSITDDIDNLSISILDICRVVGVLLDNSIEAAELCDNKFIEIIILNDDNITTFIINNSCPENTPPIYKIYEKSFSTKGLERGIGLKSVRNIIDKKYKNVSLNTKVEGLIFKQELIIS